MTCFRAFQNLVKINIRLWRSDIFAFLFIRLFECFEIIPVPLTSVLHFGRFHIYNVRFPESSFSALYIGISFRIKVDFFTHIYPFILPVWSSSYFPFNHNHFCLFFGFDFHLRLYRPPVRQILLCRTIMLFLCLLDVFVYYLTVLMIAHPP